MEGLGGQRVSVDMSSFAAAAKLLYESALVAERYSGIRSFLEQGQVRARRGNQGAVFSEQLHAACCSRQLAGQLCSCDLHCGY